MKQLKLTVQINKPVDEVFAFTLDPNNTPKWVDGISKEEASPLPTRLGTIYRNTGDGKTWATYEITAFEAGSMFVMSRHEAGYHVKYSFVPTHGGTELEYLEWTEKGDLDNPFAQEFLQKLKTTMEGNEPYVR